MKKIFFFIIFILIGILLIGYTKAKIDGHYFYNFGMFFEMKYKKITYYNPISQVDCKINFSSKIGEKAKEDESLDFFCSSPKKVLTINESSDILNAFLEEYNVNEKLKNSTVLSLQIVSKTDYYFLDFIKELNYRNIWDKKSFYNYINKDKKSFYFRKYMNNLGKIIKKSDIFNPLYKVLKKHGCDVTVPKNSLAVELFDRSYINTIVVPQYYLHSFLVEDEILNSKDDDKIIYPNIGIIFFNLECR